MEKVSNWLIKSILTGSIIIIQSNCADLKEFDYAKDLDMAKQNISKFFDRKKEKVAADLKQRLSKIKIATVSLWDHIKKYGGPASFEEWLKAGVDSLIFPKANDKNKDANMLVFFDDYPEDKRDGDNIFIFNNILSDNIFIIVKDLLDLGADPFYGFMDLLKSGNISVRSFILRKTYQAIKNKDLLQMRDLSTLFFWTGGIPFEIAFSM